MIFKVKSPLLCCGFTIVNSFWHRLNTPLTFFAKDLPFAYARRYIDKKLQEDKAFIYILTDSTIYTLCMKIHDNI